MLGEECDQIYHQEWDKHEFQSFLPVRLYQFSSFEFPLFGALFYHIICFHESG